MAAKLGNYKLLSCIAFTIMTLGCVAAEPSLQNSRRLLSYYGGSSEGSYGSSSPSGGSYGSSSSPSSGGSYGGYGSSTPKSGGSYGSSSPSSGGSYGGYGSSTPKSGGSYGSSSPSSGGSYGGYGSSTPNSGGSYGSSSPSSGGSYGSSSPTTGGGSYGKGTPKYWCGHPEHVPKFLSLLTNIAKLFGPRILSGIRGLEEKHKQQYNNEGHKFTLFGALKDESTNTMASLLREGSASLINSYAYSDEFSLSSNEVIARFNNALDSPDLASQQATQFQQLNEAL